MNFIKSAGLVAAAALGLGMLTSCGTEHTINGKVMPTDAKKVCQLMADDGLETNVGTEEGETFSKTQYKEYRAWAKDINNEEISQAFLAMGAFFKPGAEEPDLSSAMLIFSVYEDLSSACDDLGVELPDLMDAAMENSDTASESGWDEDWEEPTVEEVAPDTDQWLNAWCGLEHGMTLEEVTTRMGEPTTTMLEGEGDPQIAYDYSGFSFTVFFDTDTRVEQFSANYDTLGESDLAVLDCVSMDDEMGYLEREDQHWS